MTRGEAFETLVCVEAVRGALVTMADWERPEDVAFTQRMVRSMAGLLCEACDMLYHEVLDLGGASLLGEGTGGDRPGE